MPQTTAPAYLRELYSIAGRWSHLGSETRPDSARLIGPLRFVDSKPVAYLHSFFAPLPMIEIEQVEDIISQRLPDPLREFYSLHNGANLFFNRIAVFGKRSSLSRRDNDAMMLNPFDMVPPILSRRGQSPSGQGIVLTTSSKDGTPVFLEKDGRVYHTTSDDDPRIIAIWDGFPSWIVEEARRLNTSHDASGAEIYTDPGRSGLNS